MDKERGDVARRVVFLSNNPRFYIKPAARFGKSVFLFVMEPSTQKVEYSVGRIIGALHLIKFNPETDYIALTGTPGLLCLLTAVAVVNYDDVRILAYRPKNRTYAEGRLDVLDDQLEEGTEESDGGVGDGSAGENQESVHPAVDRDDVAVGRGEAGRVHD